MVSVFFAWIGNILVRIHHQQDIVAKIQSLGGKAYYDYQLAGEHIDAKSPAGRLSVGPDVTTSAATKLKGSLPKCHVNCYDKNGVQVFDLP